MSKKTETLYRAKETFIYPPTGRVYPEHTIDTLTDWHPDDIKAALVSLIEIYKGEAPEPPALVQTITVGEDPAFIEEDFTDG